MRTFVLRDDRILTHPLPCDNPLRLDACGAVTVGGWVAALVRSAGDLTRDCVALVVRPGARVRVGSRRVFELAELADGDHVWLGAAELILCCDALPAPVRAAPGARCGSCCEGVPELLACPRCRASRCAPCWRRAAGGVCGTPGCGAPASLDRRLWEPSLEDFVSAGREAGA
jgi:hypothetical protein